MFPSKAWFEETLRTANASEELKELGKEWEGDILIKVIVDDEAIKDLRDESFFRNYLSMMSMIPKEERVLFRGTPVGDALEGRLGILLDGDLEGIDMREVLPKITGAAKGEAICVWADYNRGRMRSFTPVAPGKHEDAAFKISGPYGAWKKVAMGKGSIAELVSKSDLELKGEIAPLVGNFTAFDALLKIFSSAARSDQKIVTATVHG